MQMIFCHTPSRLIALFVLSIFFVQCTSIEEVKPKLKQKGEPVGDYFDQRLGASSDFDISAFQRARREAATSLSKRSVPVGFSEPWRVEGPTNLGGRVNALACDPRNAEVLYAGFTNAGVWKTTDRGENWQPISDQLVFPCVGAIALDTTKNRLWVGTGDPNISGYFFLGDGLYYSDDEGSSWNFSGLGESGIITRVRINPMHPDTMYTAVMGRPYVADENRGLYRSHDGGQSWHQVLFVADTVGISDVWLDPQTPSTLYAASWPRQRTYTFSRVFGEQALLFKSTDGGETWVNLQPQIGYNLPASRLGFAIAPSNPNRLFLSVTGQDLSFDSFHKSEDGGATWTTLQRDTVSIFGQAYEPFAGFGWFFGQTRVDPYDQDHVFMLGVELIESYDAGLTWDIAEGFDVHADKHALEWAADGQAYLGTDGGLYQRPVGEFDWVDVDDIPANMFYRVATLPFDSTTFAGGMQDNGTAIGGVENIGLEWDKLFGGDGFQPVFSPDYPENAIVETQNGGIWYVSDFEVRNINLPNASQPRSWDMPIASRYDSLSGELYLLTGTNRPYTSFFDGFFDWFEDGPVVTTPQTPRPNVITAAHISADLSHYVATSGGRLWKRTENGSWSELSIATNGRYITDVTSSDANPNTLYVSMTQYRVGDNTPYLLVSKDGGDTWADATGDMPNIAINSVLVIPGAGDSLVVLGTDAGVYASINSGATYDRLGSGMTTVPVLDLAYDQLSQKLVAGTFGRSIQTNDLSKIELLAPALSSVKQLQPNGGAKRAMTVYPNPCRSYVDVQLKLLEVDRPTRFVLLDAAGKQYASWQFDAGRSLIRERLALPSDLCTGNYILVAKNRHDVFTAQLMVID